MLVMHRKRMIVWIMATGALLSLFQRAIAQNISKQSDGVGRLSFDAVSIRQNKSDKGIGMNFTADGFSATDVSLQLIIMNAYHQLGRDLMSERKLLSGAPGWIVSDKYDIRAKIAPSDLAALQKLGPEQQLDQKRLMLQAMLADRFNLQVRREAKPGACYALVVDKHGIKMKPAPAPLDPNSHEGDMFGGAGSMSARSTPLLHLIWFLTNELNCPISDRTGLTGNYAFSLQYSVGQGSGDTSSLDASRPDLFTAIREQLGLRLIPVTIPIPSIAIEHVERPSDN